MDNQFPNKSWPTLQEFNEAIQLPFANIEDAELKHCLPYTDFLGLPRPVTGAFASVYRMHREDKDFALRLFLKSISDQAQRYSIISDFVRTDKLPYTVTFEFLTNGIKARGEWHPALKMEWVEGTPFDIYLVENLNNAKRLGELAKAFLQMMNELRAAGIAHGDLQHGNMIMCGNEIRLVDYDGMYVPAMIDANATELGHPNYQHPDRASNHFGPYLDNFSSWIIYASIKALQLDPRLLNQLGGCDDCMLFRKADFLNPLESSAFAAFEKHDIEEIRNLGKFIRAQLGKDLARIPHLQTPVPTTENSGLDEIAESISSTKEGPRLIHTTKLDWLSKENLKSLFTAKASPTLLLEKESEKSKSWTVQAQINPPALWVKPTAPQLLENKNQGKKQEDLGGNLEFTSGSPYLPPVLGDSVFPRWVDFDKKLNRRPPEFVQRWMVLNPLVWIMLTLCWNVATVDEELRVHPVTYQAIVEKNPLRIGGADYQLLLNYKVGDKNYVVTDAALPGQFKPGDKVDVQALASHPYTHEPLGYPAGTTQRFDFEVACFLLGLNFLAMGLIWAKPLWHRYLASRGRPVIAKVGNRVPLLKSRKESLVTLSYYVDGKLYIKQAFITAAESKSMVIGSSEVLLCHPRFPGRFVLYRKCLYKACMFKPPKRRGF